MNQIRLYLLHVKLFLAVSEATLLFLLFFCYIEVSKTRFYVSISENKLTYERKIEKKII